MQILWDWLLFYAVYAIIREQSEHVQCRHKPSIFSPQVIDSVDAKSLTSVGQMHRKHPQGFKLPMVHITYKLYAYKHHHTTQRSKWMPLFQDTQHSLPGPSPHTPGSSPILEGSRQTHWLMNSGSFSYTWMELRPCREVRMCVKKGERL